MRGKHDPTHVSMELHEGSFPGSDCLLRGAFAGFCASGGGVFSELLPWYSKWVLTNGSSRTILFALCFWETIAISLCFAKDIF